MRSLNNINTYSWSARAEIQGGQKNVYTVVIFMRYMQGRIQKFQREGGRNLKPRQLKLFLVGQAFSLVSTYAGLRLPTCTFCHISPFNTLIFFILVYPLCGRQVARTPRKWQLPSECRRPVQNIAMQFAFS